jgi:site-specific DNA-methyltransferase (adenine-specific)
MVARSFASFGHLWRRATVAAMNAPCTVLRTRLGELFAGDALAWLSALPGASVDLVFADPPYNLGRERWDALRPTAEYLDWSRAWMAEVARVLRPTGSLYVCGFSELLADVKALAAAHFHSCRWLIWHYRNKANLGRDWGRSHESILHLRHAGFALNIDEARVPYNAHTLRYPAHPQAQTSRYGRHNYVWEPNPLGAKPRDVLEIPTLANGMREKTTHPTQKPLELVRRLVAAATAPGAVVADPFGGSGTTYVACELLGRRWLGCEIDAGYQSLIIERLAQPLDDSTSERAEARRRTQRRKLR